MRKETKEDLLVAIKETESMQSAAKYLKMSYSLFRRLAQHYGIFEPNAAGKGIAKPKVFKSEADVFKQFDYDIGRSTVKNWYLRVNEYKCSTCSISSWNNNHIVLEIEHINGDRRDNRKENLTLLCPNCHSQTKTFRKRKK